MDTAVDWEALLDIKSIRQELGASQSEMADLVGVSPRTIQSCEQGWRKPSPALEKAVLVLLLAFRHGSEFDKQKCWDVKECAPGVCDNCLARGSGQGHLCWFMTGHMCGGRRLRTWSDKKQICGACAFMAHLVGSQPKA